MNRENIVLTDNVRVASIELCAGEETPSHRHSEVTENVICLAGEIKLQYGEQGESIVLLPGQRYTLTPTTVHKLVNPGAGSSTFLLVQQGTYDFLPADESPPR